LLVAVYLFTFILKIFVILFGSIKISRIFVKEITTKTIEIMTTQAIENHTNNKIANWYKNAKIDYNVIGEGKAEIKDNNIVVNYIENGVKKTWSTAFYMDYIKENGIDFFYNIWESEA